MKTFGISTYGLVFTFLVLINLQLSSQDTIYLRNPSFEDKPRKGGFGYDTRINGWHDCGVLKFPGESPADIHPTSDAAWGVTKAPFDGKTYLGLVVRFSDTYESVSQKISTSLKANQCYSFSLVMAHDPSYKSPTARSHRQLESFANPAILNIWGGNNECQNVELLGQSHPVSHSAWKQYEFIFKPQQDLKSITLEAYFEINFTARYNGHILVDALSPIVMIPCK